MDSQCYPFKEMIFIEQFVESVGPYTSKYNNSMSVSYAPDNIIGKPVKYPCYGDFPDTYMLRSYGKWWSELESAQKEYMPQDVDGIISEDYVTVKFEHPVRPTKVFIYETYNPGAVVRLWGGNKDGGWSLLWEGLPQNCEQSSRLFSPVLRGISDLINSIRIELNQSHLRYYTSIDAVLLAGFSPKSLLQEQFINGFYRFNDMQQKNTTLENESSIIESSSFTSLPYEVIVYIFGFLDLKSLCRCAQVNNIFLSASSNSSLYRHISFKRYWNKVSNETLQYFIPKCTLLRKLDLSWCGDNNKISENTFISFLEQCGKQLTHLSLGSCNFIGKDAINIISKCKYLTDLRLRNINFTSDNIDELANLKNLSTLDLYSTNIEDNFLIKILESNQELQHLIIDLCEYLSQMDSIAETLSIYNNQLCSLSCWKTLSLTAHGIKCLAKCPNLQDLDVGWCLVLNDPADCLMHLAQGCPKLTRLVISGCRGLVDRHLLPLIQNCFKIKQLDLLGTRNISGEMCEQILQTFNELELLDVSFCDLVQQKQVAMWQHKYPHVVIQRSCGE